MRIEDQSQKKDQQKDHEFCLRCGRRLKNPDARSRGYGAVCFRKSQIVEKLQLFNPFPDCQK